MKVNSLVVIMSAHSARVPGFVFQNFTILIFVVNFQFLLFWNSVVGFITLLKEQAYDTSSHGPMYVDFNIFEVLMQSTYLAHKTFSFVSVHPHWLVTVNRSHVLRSHENFLSDLWIKFSSSCITRSRYLVF